MRCPWLTKRLWPHKFQSLIRPSPNYQVSPRSELKNRKNQQREIPRCTLLSANKGTVAHSITHTKAQSSPQLSSDNRKLNWDWPLFLWVGQLSFSFPFTSTFSVWCTQSFPTLTVTSTGSSLLEHPSTKSPVPPLLLDSFIVSTLPTFSLSSRFTTPVIITTPPRKNSNTTPTRPDLQIGALTL